MGCKNSRTKEVVITVPFRPQNAISPQEDLNRINDEVSEYSLRECSLIPIQTENGLRRLGSDPSIFKMMQDIS